MASKSTSDSFGSASFSGEDKVKELKNVLKGQRKSEEELVSSSEKKTQPEDRGATKALEEKLAQTEEEMKSYREKSLRTLAEYENFRKRMAKEKDEMIQYGNEKLLKEMIPVLDHLEMTLEHVEEVSGKEQGIKPDKDDPMVEGIRLVIKEFLKVLKKFGVEVVSGEGCSFDPHHQEAIGHVEVPGKEEGTVVKVHRKGFLLHKRLIRPALVSIANQGAVETRSKEDSKG